MSMFLASPSNPKVDQPQPETQHLDPQNTLKNGILQPTMRIPITSRRLLQEKTVAMGSLSASTRRLNMSGKVVRFFMLNPMSKLIHMCQLQNRCKGCWSHARYISKSQMQMSGLIHVSPKIGCIGFWPNIWSTAILRFARARKGCPSFGSTTSGAHGSERGAFFGVHWVTLR